MRLGYLVQDGKYKYKNFVYRKKYSINIDPWKTKHFISIYNVYT